MTIFGTYNSQLFIWVIIFSVRVSHDNYHYVNPNQAEKAGSMMIRILKNTGTDSDVFPEYEILKIKEAVRFPWESYLKD